MSGMVNERAIPNPPKPCGEKSSDQTKEDDIGLDQARSSWRGAGQMYLTLSAKKLAVGNYRVSIP